MRSGSETRRRSGIIGFRASAAERQEVEANAARAGLTLSSYARASMLKAPRTRAVRPPPSVNIEKLAYAVGQLGRVGGNLAQMLRLMNFNRENWDIGLPEALAEVRAASAAIMDAMGRGPR